MPADAEFKSIPRTEVDFIARMADFDRIPLDIVREGQSRHHNRNVEVEQRQKPN
jgi:hypothetical protein